MNKIAFITKNNSRGDNMITLSNKERMLLEDEKSHEQLCIEKYSKYINETQCQELKNVLNSSLQQEKSHLDSINQMLNGQVPNFVKAQKQGQQQGQNNQMQNMQNNSQITNQSNKQGYNKNDYQICTDLLATEKYVSSTYNTAVFEFTNHDFRNALNHIQKEEQEHGEALFDYMQSKGMYNPK